MMNILRADRVRPAVFAAVALGAVAVLGACQLGPPVLSPVRHVVLIWMRHPGRVGERTELVRAARSLRMVPGVERVRVEREVPGLPVGASRNYDLGVVITFRDRTALQRYKKDPRHSDALLRYLRPLVRRYEVYDLSIR